MNAKVIKTLEYNKIIDLLTEEANSSLGKQRCRELLPYSEEVEIHDAQTETSHALVRIFRHGSLDFHGLKDIRPCILPLEKGSVLGSGELLDISAVLRVAKRAVSYDLKDDEYTDTLSGRFHGLNTIPELDREINRCIISPEEISDDASSGLKRIRQMMKTKGSKIHEQLNSLVNSHSVSGMLRENIITMRNGRYCVPVKQEYKSSFPGMVHDQSSSGSTFFIEPMAVVKLNNELAELAIAEQEEIQKILAALSEMAAPYTNDLAGNVVLLSELDFIFAKAKLSKNMQASEPFFCSRIHIKRGRHPLIPRNKVVPIDVTLGDDYSLLIITGPNTGGKTVSLKTIGLFTLMGQAGLHIPAFDRSELRIFKEVYADIGDEQSIEQSLSTFSSHMTNTISILEKADDQTLALFDELGAGTDPVEGAALAISILDDLKKRRVTVMATTHYSELKLYALSTDGVENASCEFDIETLRPTYRLIIGIPGKSNAFAISSKLGLPDRIISEAEKRIDSDVKSFEDIISELEMNRAAIEKEKEETRLLKKEASRLKEKLEQKNSKLDAAKEKVLQRANEEANKILQNAKDMADDSIKKFNKWIADGTNKEMEQQRTALREELAQTEKNLTLRPRQTKNNAPKKLHIGDMVFVHSMGVKGTVSTLPDKNGKLNVQMGIIRSTVSVNDLELIQEKPENEKKSHTNSGKLRMDKALQITPEINLIGKTTDEALPLLDKYLDDAYLTHLPKVTVIHGVGTGALKKAVQTHIKKVKYVKSYRSGEFGEGGAGVTVVEFK